MGCCPSPRPRRDRPPWPRRSCNPRAARQSTNTRRSTLRRATTPAPGSQPFRQGIDFLGEPVIADVTGDGQADVVDGGDSNAMHAYDSLGSEPPGFPKWTPGWTLSSPAIGDLLSSGRTDLVTVTREGYLFAWRTLGEASANAEWWRAQHDEWNSGNYGIETRPPGVVRAASWAPGDETLSFLAPGQRWYSGPAPTYLLTSFAGRDHAHHQGIRGGGLDPGDRDPGGDPEHPDPGRQHRRSPGRSSLSSGLAAGSSSSRGAVWTHPYPEWRTRNRDVRPIDPWSA